jgi:fucose permease
MIKSRLSIKLSLLLNYIVFAILLNSVGAVILQVQGTFAISKSTASVLEGFKDIPIALFSFLMASLLPLLGLKRGMLIGLAMVTAIALCMPLIANEFWYFKILFAVVGIAFAIVKVASMATIGLITHSSSEHSSFMSTLEGFFMIGVLLGNVFFSLFVDDENIASRDWLNVYYYLSAFSALAFLLLYFSPLDEQSSQLEGQSFWVGFKEMIRLGIQPLIWVFIASVFLYVLIEQSFMTWTPTFYKDILKVPNSMSIQAAAVLASAIALGRLLAGGILRKIHWLPYLLTSLLMVSILVIVSLFLSSNLPTVTEQAHWWKAPWVVYIFPLMGLFLAPIYPTVNSVILSSLPTHQHSSMSGLIVVFSALGGTTGSLITGSLFEWVGGKTAFYFSLIPIFVLAACLLALNKMSFNKMHS